MLTLLISLLAIVAVWILCEPSRYVTDFKKVEMEYSGGKSELLTAADRQIVEVLRQIGEKAKTLSWFLQADEHFLVNITDLDNLNLTISVQNGQYSIQPGWIQPEKKTLLLSVRQSHISRLAEIISDSQFTQSELYEIASVALVPVLESLYNAEVLYFPGDKRFLELDNFMHVEVVNDFNLKDEYGNPLQAKATVMNVDGQWLVYQGHKGDPDVKYVVTADHMLQFYYLLHYKCRAVESGDFTQRKKLLDEYMLLRAKTQVFNRHE